MIHSIIMQVLQTIPTKPPKHFLGGKTKRQFARPRNRTKYEYDSLSRLKAVERTLSERQDYTYFKNNQPKSVIDAYGRSTTYGYNDKNELSTTTHRDSGVVQFFYDDNGQTERIRDPLGVNTTYDRDGFGQTWRRVSPGTGTTAYEYDLAGNLIKKTDANGELVHYEYDAASRLRYVRVNSNPNPVQSFTYNALTGFLDQVVDEVGTHTFVHNQAGEVLSLTSVVHGVSLNTSYTYNAMGQVETMTYPTGLVATYHYGTIGEVTKITVDNGGTLNNADVVKDVEYYPYGPVSNFDYGNNESRSNVLDLQYEPYKLLSGAHIDRTFTLDYNGNITGFDAESFTYDSMDRLGTYNDRDGVTFEYDYDLNGNRKWHKRNGAQTTYYYNSARTQLNSLAGATSESRSYDNNGNTIQIDNRYFDHDELNRLYRYRDGGLTVDYKYNAIGERQVKADGGPKVRFVYNGPWLLHERVGAVRRDYIYLGAEIVGMVKDGALYYVHNDHLGRPEVVTNGAGNPVWSSRNDAHDNTPIVDTIGGFNVGFPGQYYDVESGAYYNYFRTYDATTGRYLQSDPIGLAGGLNTYNYAGSNPLVFTDPLGLIRDGGNRNPLILNATDQGFGGGISGVDGVVGVCRADGTNVTLVGENVADSLNVSIAALDVGAGLVGSAMSTVESTSFSISKYRLAAMNGALSSMNGDLAMVERARHHIAAERALTGQQIGRVARVGGTIVIVTGLGLAGFDAYEGKAGVSKPILLFGAAVAGFLSGPQTSVFLGSAILTLEVGGDTNEMSRELDNAVLRMLE